jgi:hypothetical protein
VRLGNRAVDDSGSGVVIGTWPWLLNNPGDLTGSLKPQQDKHNAKSFRKDERVWGRPISAGTSPDKMQPVQGSTGLDSDNTAVEGHAARTDLAIFADRQRGRNGLKDWIQKYYADVTLAACVKKHLGPSESHVPGVDDPEKYPKRLQQYLSDKNGAKYAPTYVASTLGKDVKENEWEDVIDAFGYAEGMYSRREVAGKPGKFEYVEQKGIVYHRGGRDPIEVDPVYRNLPRVKAMPQTTPPEILALLGGS